MPGRRDKRFRVANKIPVAFMGAQTHFTVDLRDISTSGCLLIHPNPQLQIGTHGRLGIPVGHETLRAGVVAKRIIPGVGVGFEFSEMVPNDRELLRRLIASISNGQRTNA